MSTLPAEPKSNDEFELVLQLIRSAFAAGYAQGQFDHAGGFNVCVGLADVTKEWMNDHREIFTIPVDIGRVSGKLAAEANELKKLTSI